MMSGLASADHGDDLDVVAGLELLRLAGGALDDGPVDHGGAAPSLKVELLKEFRQCAGVSLQLFAVNLYRNHASRLAEFLRGVNPVRSLDS